MWASTIAVIQGNARRGCHRNKRRTNAQDIKAKMSRLTVKYIVLSLLFLVTLSCGRTNVSEPLPADQVAQALQQSFQSASTPTLDAVTKIIGELQRHDVAASFTDIKALGAMPNLTKEQQITAIRAAHTIGQQLQEAVASGDEKAAETMHTYNASH
jgi:hypothetical protein